LSTKDLVSLENLLSINSWNPKDESMQL
jgi:hypothetical protein